MHDWESVQPDPKIVGELVRLIVAAASPLCILLFGSAARGNMHPDSDLDVLVVLAEGVPRRRTCQKIYRHLIGFPAAVDVLVTTEEELSKHQDNFSLIYYSASREGKEIYVAKPTRGGDSV